MNKNKPLPQLETEPAETKPAEATPKKPNRKFYGLFSLLAVVVGVAMLSFTPVKTFSRSEVNQDSVISQVNRERIKKGLDELVYDPQLTEAAYDKAYGMIEQNYFGHFHNDETPWDYIVEAGANDWTMAGENLAKNYEDSQTMVTAWMNSELHRANILKSGYRKTGVAVVKTEMANGSNLTLVVQLFTDV